MNGRRGWACLLFVAVLWVTSQPAAEAHPISVSRASVYLTRKAATIRIEIFLEDLYLFHSLQPNEADFLDVATIERGVELHRRFLGERFEVRDVEGTLYQPRAVRLVEADLPVDGVPLADLMAHRLRFELDIQFPEPPAVLIFTQRFTDEVDMLPSEVNLRIQQEGSEGVSEQTLLPQEPYSLRIDWEHPPLAAEASEQERAAWSAREQQVLLGITNQSRVYSFLYCEDFEVRHEILAPLASLAKEFGLAAGPNTVVSPAQQDEVRATISDFFATGNPIVIDGHPIQPVVERCEFYGLDRRDFAETSNSRPVPLANARVGVILSYRTASPPAGLRMTWDRFNDQIWGVTTVVIDGDQVSRNKLTRVGGRNVLEWQRADDVEQPESLNPVMVDLRIQRSLPPIRLAGLLVGLSSLLFGAGTLARNRSRVWLGGSAAIIGGCVIWTSVQRSPPSLADQDAVAVFEQLHRNLYQSFTRTTEESVYDALSVSVDGELLREIYLEVQRGLVMQDQGGALARIGDVALVSSQPIVDPDPAPPTFRLSCRWNVAGTVEHWGHRHQRTNQYQAEFVVAPVEGNWKLVGMELLDEQRLSSETTVRSL